MRARNDLVIAGGGTGGHFFCGLAIAEKHLERYPKSSVLFVGVKRGIEGRTPLPDPRMKIQFISAAGFKNVTLSKKVEALFLLMLGFFESLFILMNAQPRMVVGVGGYASASVMLAAFCLKFIMRFDVAVVEQNSIPGVVNRFFSKLPISAYSAFSSPGFQTMSLPIRKKVEDFANEAREPIWPPKKIFVMGGSQGASGLNKAWILMLPKLKEYNPQLEFVHQTGAQGLESIQAAYRDLGLSANCFSFSNEIGRFLQDVDLVISRAGALSIFELITFSRPVVFVPFPHAADNHQFKNAISVQDLDWVISETEFRWENFERILKSSSPKVPSPKFQVKHSWRSLFHF